MSPSAHYLPISSLCFCMGIFQAWSNQTGLNRPGEMKKGQGQCNYDFLYLFLFTGCKKKVCVGGSGGLCRGNNYAFVETKLPIATLPATRKSWMLFIPTWHLVLFLESPWNSIFSRLSSLLFQRTIAESKCCDTTSQYRIMAVTSAIK